MFTRSVIVTKDNIAAVVLYVALASLALLLMFALGIM